MGTETKQEVAVVNDKIITTLIEQLKEKEKYGMTFPSDYNIDNELFGAYVTLKNTKDKNGKCVLYTCTKDSICNSLMQMARNCLSLNKGQCYMIPFNGVLTCMPSTYGHEVNAKRCGMKKIHASVIYKDDVFKMHKEDGVIIIDEHQTSFENIDITKIVGAYAVATMEDGTKEIEVMTMSQIEMAWKQGFGYKQGGNGTHQKFTDQMCEKTVKNRLMKHIIRGHGEYLSTSYEEIEETTPQEVFVDAVQHDITSNENKEEFIIDEPHTEEAVQEEVQSDVVETAEAQNDPF